MVGDDVPISTGTANVLTTQNTVVNTIDYRRTGIILRVDAARQRQRQCAARHRAGDQPGLQLRLATAATQNLTPTISQRKVKSSIAVATGQTVLLAGLIQEQKEVDHSGIPLLDQLPALGNVVGEHRSQHHPHRAHHLHPAADHSRQRRRALRRGGVADEAEGHARAGAALCRPGAAGPVTLRGTRQCRCAGSSSMSRTRRSALPTFEDVDHRHRGDCDGRCEHDRGAGCARCRRRRPRLPDGRDRGRRCPPLHHPRRAQRRRAGARARPCRDRAPRRDRRSDRLRGAARRHHGGSPSSACGQLYRRLRGREGIGLGDVKLAGVAGAWLDWQSIPIAVEIAALAALAVCLVRWLATSDARSARPPGCRSACSSRRRSGSPGSARRCCRKFLRCWGSGRV